MKQSVKIAITAAAAVALFGLIVLGRYLFSEITRLQVGESPVTVEETAPTSTAIENSTSTDEALQATSTDMIEYNSGDDWTTFVLPEGTTLTNPFTFNGTTTAFENTINWRLSDENGIQISEGYANVYSSDIGIPGPFEVKTFFNMVPATKVGVLEVFELSARDGSEIHKATANITFPEGSQTIKVYFANVTKTPEGDECEAVYPVERMVTAGDKAEIAIYELLKGPNIMEINADYYSSLPEDIPNPEIFYKKDGVHLDFSDALEYQVAGSCRIQSIYKQIEETVKEATGEEEITISINGRTEDILQP
jgi:Immunoglobulin-like domain of bacterial spore germination/Sporulation and spore germination